VVLVIEETLEDDCGRHGVDPAPFFVRRTARPLRPCLTNSAFGLYRREAFIPNIDRYGQRRPERFHKGSRLFCLGASFTAHRERHANHNLAHPLQIDKRSDFVYVGRRIPAFNRFEGNTEPSFRR
jgi:hypothetical protein